MNVEGQETNGEVLSAKVLIIGGGAWGTALACHCARAGHATTIWARETEVVESINSVNENTTFLKGCALPVSLKATSNLEAAIAENVLILTVIPTPFVHATLKPVSHLFTKDHIICSCSKGIENNSLETLDKILLRSLPEAIHNRLCFLSGPSFAVEVARENPTAVTIASADENLAIQVQRLMSTEKFRCYRTTDVVGVEICGALKNVLAIACGMNDGLNYGHNGRAALITRGLVEITKIGVALGAQSATFSGLSGMGDIVLTCCGDLSRNRTVGFRIGKGETIEDIQASMTAYPEGVLTTKSVYNLVHGGSNPLLNNVETPIIDGVYKVLYNNEDPKDIVKQIMTRPLKQEEPTFLTASKY